MLLPSITLLLKLVRIFPPAFKIKIHLSALPSIFTSGSACHNDQTFFDNLDQVLLYICKQDQFLIDKRLLGNVHTFATSNRTKQPKTVGRPRIFKIIPNPIPQDKLISPVTLVKKKLVIKPSGKSL